MGKGQDEHTHVAVEIAQGADIWIECCKVQSADLDAPSFFLSVSRLQQQTVSSAQYFSRFQGRVPKNCLLSY